MLQTCIAAAIGGTTSACTCRKTAATSRPHRFAARITAAAGPSFRQLQPCAARGRAPLQQFAELLQLLPHSCMHNAACTAQHVLPGGGGGGGEGGRDGWLMCAVTLVPLVVPVPLWGTVVGYRCGGTVVGYRWASAVAACRPICATLAQECLGRLWLAAHKQPFLAGSTLHMAKDNQRPGALAHQDIRAHQGAAHQGAAHQGAAHQGASHIAFILRDGCTA